MGYFCYILRCADDRYYYGSTADLVKRLEAHQRGSVRTTKPRRPVRLVYYEEFETKDESKAREQQFKNGKTRKETRDRLIAAFPAERLLRFGR